MIKINNLTIKYNDKAVIHNLSLDIIKKQLTLIKGANGSGKSTLMYAISGIIPRNIEAYVSGDIYIDGRNIKDLSHKDLISAVGIVIQNPDNMLFSPTVEDELAFAPENLCYPREIIRDRVEKAIKLTEIEKFRYLSPSKLSGGEKQRVAIASVLTLDPTVIIFDEILNCLDEHMKEIIIKLIITLKKQDKTIIMIEHNNIIDDIADKVINLGDL